MAIAEGDAVAGECLAVDRLGFLQLAAQHQNRRQVGAWLGEVRLGAEALAG